MAFLLGRTTRSISWVGEQAPHGFEEFYESVDVVVIGRKTFEVVLTFGKWFYGEKPVVVLSGRPLDLSSVKGAVVEQMSGEPAEIVTQLNARGFQTRLYRRRHHHSAIPGGRTHRPIGDHTRAYTNRSRHPLVRPGATRHQSASCCDALL